MLVQIIKDGYGEKGPRVSAGISLAGRTVALTPGEPGIRVSRRISDKAERDRLARAAEAAIDDDVSLGAVVRTAAAGLDEARLAAELASLTEAWTDIAAKARVAAAPALMRREAGLLGRVMRDIFTDTVKRVEVDTTDALQRVRHLANTLAPDLADRVTLYPGGAALFEDRGVEAEIEAALQPRVPLERGAWLSIERTEGFTAIDVNAGGSVEGGSQSPSMEINLEAAREIARQVRLRSLSGLIVVDFIHVAAADDAARLTRALESAFAADPVHTRISPMSEFGLTEITRRREHEALADLLQADLRPLRWPWPCPQSRCRGAGGAALGRTGRNPSRRRDRRAGIRRRCWAVDGGARGRESSLSPGSPDRPARPARDNDVRIP